MHTYEVEVTDTFAGEANYSWVLRERFAAPSGASRRAIVRRAKAAAGLSNVRCDTHDYGDLIELRPRGACIVAFVTLTEEEGAA